MHCPLRLAFILAISTALALGACAKRGRGGAGAAGGADGDFVTGTPLADRQEGVSFFSPNVDRSRFEPVYFGYDSSGIPAGERGKIARVAEEVKSGGQSVIIAGFTDERGTAEYNRALGEKRAGAVREALIAAGVDADRVQTVSFGAEMPADPGHSESAWAKNRRAEFGVTR